MLIKILFYRQFRLCITKAKPIPYGCAHPKAPSGRELSPKVTEGECVTMKLAQTQIHAGSFHR